MQVGQRVGVHGLLLPHHSRDHWPENGLVHHPCGLGLQQLPDRYVAVNPLHVGIVPQHLIGQILGDLFLHIGQRTLLGSRVFVPFLLLILLVPEFLYLL